MDSIWKSLQGVYMLALDLAGGPVSLIHTVGMLKVVWP